MTQKRKYAFISDGAVAAVRKYVPGRQPEGVVEVTSQTGDAGTGWAWDGSTFTAPARPDIPAGDLPSLVRQEGRRRLAALVEDYTDLERETWKGQLAEAQLVADGGSSALISALAVPRGLSAADMAQVIIAKDAALKAAIGPILAAQEALLNADPIPQDYRDDTHWP